MYIRDQWFRDAHTAMGYAEALQREVHVYFNGLYWGMHHLFERIEEEWAAERFGGLDDDWEGFRIVAGNNIEIINGTPAEEAANASTAGSAVVDAALAGDLDAVQEYLDLDAYIDYMLLNFHAGNTDWDGTTFAPCAASTRPGSTCSSATMPNVPDFNVRGAPSRSRTSRPRTSPMPPTGINTALRSHSGICDPLRRPRLQAPLQWRCAHRREWHGPVGRTRRRHPRGDESRERALG